MNKSNRFLGLTSLAIGLCPILLLLVSVNAESTPKETTDSEIYY